MPLASRRPRRDPVNYWPGFVDALAAVLMVIVFVVVVFALSQFFLSESLSGRDEALSRLNRQIGELDDLLGLERAANADLRLSIAQISEELRGSIADREAMDTRLTGLQQERAVLLDEQSALRLRLLDLDKALDELGVEKDALAADLEAARATAATDRETLELQLREIESLQRDIAALQTVRADLEAEIAAQAGQLGLSTTELARERDRRRALEARLATASEETVLAQRALEARDIRLEELLSRAEAAETAMAGSDREVALLSERLQIIREQLAVLNDSLEVSETRNRAQQATIVDLDRRLNAALANRVQELAGYRSEFFGRLRGVLGERAGIDVVGDRFVFQSEVLFPSASAELEPGGREQLARLAETLRDIAAEIPADIDWVMRIDGHTDARPINTPAFPSNWELSTARAISVLRFMVDAGIPPERLVAAGFGEHHPLDNTPDEQALQRNRRIEFKLTQR